MTDPTDRTNFRFALGVVVALASLGAVQVSIALLDYLGVEWTSMPVEPITIIGWSVLGAVVLYLVLIVVCAAVRPPQAGTLFIAGSAGILPTVLVVFLMLDYVLEWHVIL